MITFTSPITADRPFGRNDDAEVAPAEGVRPSVRDGQLGRMKLACVRLSWQHLIDGAGRWVQQEQPDAVADLHLRLPDQVGLNSGS